MANARGVRCRSICKGVVGPPSLYVSLSPRVRIASAIRSILLTHFYILTWFASELWIIFFSLRRIVVSLSHSTVHVDHDTCNRRVEWYSNRFLISKRTKCFGFFVCFIVDRRLKHLFRAFFPPRYNEWTSFFVKVSYDFILVYPCSFIQTWK